PAGVFAGRPVVERQVWDLRQRVVQLLRGVLRLRLESRDFGLQARDLGLELLRNILLVALLGGADLLRGGVAARERRFRLLDGGAPALVRRGPPLCLPREARPPARPGGP